MAYNRLGNMEEVTHILPENQEKKNSLYYQCLNCNTEDELHVWGYCKSEVKLFIFNFLSVITLFIPYLLVYWRPDWGVFLKRRKCLLSCADSLILKDAFGYSYVSTVKIKEVSNLFPLKYVINVFTEKNKVTPTDGNLLTCEEGRLRFIKYFTHQYLKYIWVPKDKCFICVHGFDSTVAVHSILHDYKGYTKEEQEQLLELYGLNSILIEVKSYTNLLVTEVLNPFYFFQIASIILWSCDDYYFYAACIFLISCLSLGISLFETRKQSEVLHNMVEASSVKNIFLLQHIDTGLVEVECKAIQIVPGDIIVIPSSGCVMACDAVLISGNAIVNESMLTGESVPVTKTPITVSSLGEMYSSEQHKRHTLFCGTYVVQTRYYGKEKVMAVVVRTGFNTAKGELVRSILYPRPLDFKLYKDTMKAILILFLIASVGMAYSVYIYIIRKETVLKTIVRALDIVTIVVPPALPAAMTVGTYYSQNRLKKRGIFCISPPRINVCGQLKTICFDKTGTLTEDGLEIWGAVPVEKYSLVSPVSNIHELDFRSHFVAALACCHSLTYVNGVLIGDPLDLKMFEATKWVLEEPGSDDTTRFNSLTPTVVKPPNFYISSVKLISSNVDLLCLQEVAVGNLSSLNTLSKPLNSVVGAGLCTGEVGVFGIQGIASAGKGDDDDIKIRNSYTSDVIEIPTDTLVDLTDDCNETLMESPAGSSNFNSLIPSMVKPSHQETYINPSRIANISETSFQVPYEIGIVRQFPFSSLSQRMSVIVRILCSSHMDLYAKGAPEVIQGLCQPNTVPDDLHEVLARFTTQGFRVIAVAHRPLKGKLSWHAAQRIARDEVECEMNFLGLLVMQNMLKAETTPVIYQLKSANIRTIMVTGDNILTGLCVARDCGMIDARHMVLCPIVTPPKSDKPATLSFQIGDSSGFASQPIGDHITVPFLAKNMEYHIAVTGKTWSQIREYFPKYIPYIVSKGTVFARMSPEQKTQLVEELQALDYIVGMCGDGANDCGALKAAHVGISLSEAEASVAAPFTSRTPNITCVPAIICEGRCALTTNFSVFKYMALYSIIQFVSVLILYHANTNLSDGQFLYIDLFIITVIAIFMGCTEANMTLSKKRPFGSLLTPVNLFSIFSQVILVISAQIASYVYLQHQPWYTPISSSISWKEITANWDSTTLFYVSSFQYLVMAVVFSAGKPFRKPLYTNVRLLLSLMILTTLSLILLIYPMPWMSWLLMLKDDPEDHRWIYRGILLGIIFVHIFASLVMERIVVKSTHLKKFLRCLCCKKEPKNRYRKVLKEIEEDVTWPPINFTIKAANL